MPAPERDEDKTRKLLVALAELGAMGPLIGLLAEMAEFDMPVDDLRYLNGPVIVHGNAWQDLVPKKLIGLIPEERARIVLAKDRPFPDMVVGPLEIAAVMMPATFEAPLHHDLYELYMWASCRAAAKLHGGTPEEMWEKQRVSPNDRFITDEDVVTRGGHLWNTYWPLAGEIRRKVVQHCRDVRAGRAKANGPAAEAEATTTPASPAPAADPPVFGVQISLF